ncbi:uncharacterized protein LTR77_003285 [Saxophila tyrrhenica]|uniref:VanZ-like domain-containing protein n=1 Tax=Saxophila tyrrhenica TaxID=1690608 RepID=A0AAV9PLH1_9PEZI|nr:hypothetical protein LTR77_003285 [Saxophila tyrrhenica]
MPAIRIRQPFAAAFAVLLLASAYLGLSTQKIPSYGQSDKGLHFVTFLLLTLTFYWILETSRRRCIHLTLVVVTVGLGIGSEVVQALLPNDRLFDPYDVLANVVGSVPALLACSWYHKRMLERRRMSKHYDIVPGEDQDELEDPERDVELGTVRDQETGVVGGGANGQATAGAGKTDVTEELDHWDENAEDWDDDPVEEADDAKDSKKRAD